MRRMPPRQVGAGHRAARRRALRPRTTCSCSSRPTARIRAASEGDRATALGAAYLAGLSSGVGQEPTSSRRSGESSGPRNPRWSRDQAGERMQEGKRASAAPSLIGSSEADNCHRDVRETHDRRRCYRCRSRCRNGRCAPMARWIRRPSATATLRRAAICEPYARCKAAFRITLSPSRSPARHASRRLPVPGALDAACSVPLPRSDDGVGDCGNGPHAHRRGLRRGARESCYHHITTGGGSLAARRAAAARRESRRRRRRGGRSTHSAASSSRTGARHECLRLRDRREPLARHRAAAAAARCRCCSDADGKLHLSAAHRSPPRARERRLARGLRPQDDRWSARKALPGAREHVGGVAQPAASTYRRPLQHLRYNTELPHVYVAAADTWECVHRYRVRSGTGLARPCGPARLPWAARAAS